MKTKLVTLLSLASAFVLSAHAGSATWNQNPGSGAWEDAANWVPMTVPSQPTDVASFGISSVTSLTISDTTEMASMVFESNADSYTISAMNGPQNIVFEGDGIINQSGSMQNFQLGTPGGFITTAIFENTSQAGMGTTFNVEGEIEFLDSSSAGGATIGDNDDVDFDGNSNAGTCHVTIAGTDLDRGVGAVAVFRSTANAAQASFTINANTNAAAIVPAAAIFYNTSNAAQAIFTCMGATLNRSRGGSVEFQDSSTAGAATLIALAGSNGGLGGSIEFEDTSSGGTAQIQVSGNASLNLTHHPNSLTIGSLEGDGAVLLAKAPLNLGSNNLSASFAGTIQKQGSIVKVGTGALTFTGANTYSGGTTISGGMLIADNTTGSATGSGTVAIAGGLMGGDGTISGATTVGTGSGPGAIIAPAAGTNAAATLTIQNTLTFATNGSYSCLLSGKAKKAVSDQVAAKGVTITSGAQFVLTDQITGRVRSGTSFTVISNTASTPISGTFANLADGATVTVNGTNFQANYEGGDGNDLTLTVVP